MACVFHDRNSNPTLGVIMYCYFYILQAIRYQHQRISRQAAVLAFEQMFNHIITHAQKLLALRAVILFFNGFGALL